MKTEQKGRTIYYTINWCNGDGLNEDCEHDIEHFKTKGERKERLEELKDEFNFDCLEYTTYISNKCKCCGSIIQKV